MYLKLRSKYLNVYLMTYNTFQTQKYYNAGWMLNFILKY